MRSVTKRRSTLSLPYELGQRERLGHVALGLTESSVETVALVFLSGHPLASSQLR